MRSSHEVVSAMATQGSRWELHKPQATEHPLATLSCQYHLMHPPRGSRDILCQKARMNSLCLHRGTAPTHAQEALETTLACHLEVRFLSLLLPCVPMSGSALRNRELRLSPRHSMLMLLANMDGSNALVSFIYILHSVYEEAWFHVAIHCSVLFVVCTNCIRSGAVMQVRNTGKERRPEAQMHYGNLKTLTMN